MREKRDYSIKLKEKLEQSDYEDIYNLQSICLEIDQITLKLELDYKLARSQGGSKNFSNINEFLYYDGNMLLGYIGICEFSGNTLELNGMVHPAYRKRGIFKRLYSLVKDELNKRESKTILLLCDHKSESGFEFIKNTGALHAHSEYEMYLKNDLEKALSSKNVVLRKATNEDGKEIAWQNSIYFDIEYKDEDIIMPEEEEKHGSLIFIVEVDNKVVGKVHLEIIDGLGGIYGLGVLPEQRGKGYGRAILMEAVKILKEKNAKNIMLQVEAQNKNALNLYKSCGFQETSTMDYYELKI